MPSSPTARRLVALLCTTCLSVGGCAVGVPTGAGPAKPRPKAGTAPKPVDASALEPPPAPAGRYFGRVLGVDGKPAADVEIRAYVIANNGSALISSNGAGLVTDNGAGYRLAQVAAAATRTARTDAKGEFSLQLAAGERVNVEAVAANDLKAIRGGVGADSSGIELKLAPTGTIKGTVTTPADRRITNYRGVDVYIPGTSYLAKADERGAFQIDGVPVGAYKLFAEKTGVGTGVSSTVKVESRKVAEVAELLLEVQPITLEALEPRFARPGTRVTVRGARFGKSSGAPFALRVGGLQVEDAVAQDDQTATFTVPKVVSGDVVIEVDGQKSNPLPIKIFDSFDVTGPSGPLAVGSSFQSTTTLNGIDYEPIPGADPPLVWKVLSGDAVTIDAEGKFQAVKLGTAQVEASYGGLVARFAVEVTDKGAVSGQLGGPAARAIAELVGVAVDAQGTIFVAAPGRILRVGADGKLETLAGGAPGTVGDLTGKDARFEGITGLAADPAGRLIVADAQRLREVQLATGAVRTIAGSTSLNGDGISKDGLGRDARVGWASGPVAVGAGGVALFMDSGVLRRLGADGAVKSGADDLGLNALAADAAGAFWGIAGRSLFTLKPDATGVQHSIQPLAKDWPPAAEDEAVALALDGQGDFYVAFATAIVRVAAADGAVSLIAGDAQSGQADGPGPSARFNKIVGLAHQPGAGRGTLIVVEDNAVRRLTLGDAPAVTTIVHGEAGGEVHTAEPAAAATGATVEDD